MSDLKARKTCVFCKGDGCLRCKWYGYVETTIPIPEGPDENSQEAAASLKPIVGRLRREVYDHIAEHGPIAEWEVALGTGLQRATTTARINELHNAGQIKRMQKKGRTPSNRPCWRYIVVKED
jgi:hypothetical protein